MKKLILISAIITLTAKSVNAQSYEDTIKGGVWKPTKMLTDFLKYVDTASYFYNTDGTMAKEMHHPRPPFAVLINVIDKNNPDKTFQTYDTVRDFSMTTYAYKNGLLTEKVYYLWYEEPKWVKTEKTVYNYDSRGVIAEITNYRWNFDKNNWMKSDERKNYSQENETTTSTFPLFTFDKNHNPVEATVWEQFTEHTYSDFKFFAIGKDKIQKFPFEYPKINKK